MLHRPFTWLTLLVLLATLAIGGSVNYFPQTPPRVSGNAKLLSEAGTAYNPIPSPDGTMIAFVRTGWGRYQGTTGLGRSNLRSDVLVMNKEGKVIPPNPLAYTFLAGWTSDGKRVICFRDYICFLASLDGNKAKEARMPSYGELYKRVSVERSGYCGFLGSMCWIRRADDCDYLESASRKVGRISHPLGEMLVPSPNGQYIAAVNTQGEGTLWVYDTERDSWANLGEGSFHPDRDWDYIKPSWDPWFRDSSRLVFVSKRGLVVSSPDGKDQRLIMRLEKPAGLPVASPDGKKIAFVTFEPTPRELRPDLLFWGGTTIWVVASQNGAKPQLVTQKALEATYDLNWLNNDELVFDRFGAEPLYRDAHIWKARVQAR